MKKSSPSGTTPFWKGFVPALVLLTAVIGFLFRDSFKPGYALFANDGPLGVLMSDALQVPEVLRGFWMDLNWIGMNGSAAASSFTYLVLWFFGPVGFAKFYAPITLILLGASAWIYFRTLNLSSALCTVASLGAALNMNFFSNTCWGLGTRSLTLASAFLALAALSTRRAGHPWLNAALAGLCVGCGVIEGADNGAIFSLYVAAFVVFQALVEGATWPARIVSSLRVAVVGVFAMFIAAQVLITLTGIASKTSRTTTASAASAVLTPEEKAAEAQKQWVFATQWSLPPVEMLRVIIPGVFGYRMDTPDGGEYWGRVGEYWAMPDGPERRASRSSGAGEYAGALVVLVGLWALVQALRRQESAQAIFDARERKYVLFWAATLVVSMVFSWGYHAPFYKLVYGLPYFSTIRNPMKFMHPGHMALMILFAYGLLGLSRRYLEVSFAAAGSLGERFRSWKSRALASELWWFRGSIAAAALAFLVFLGYSNARGNLVKRLNVIGYPEEARATAIARHSSGEVGKFAVTLLASIGLVTLVQIGMFAGPRARWAALLYGGLLVIDLGRANLPWIKHYDYREQYASNPIIDILASQPWLHRVAAFPTGLIRQEQAAQQIGILNQVWRGPWLQYLAQYYNIQSIDMAQEPRPPSEKTNYLAHVSSPVSRLWELTNTRYLLGLAGPFADVLNQQLDPARRSFRVHTPFAFTQTPAGNISAQTNTTGPWALVEFGGALPRASLYANWQISTNDDSTLKTLGSSTFDPHQVVLVDGPIAPPSSSAATNTTAGTVEFASYAPKQIELKANANVPCVLLLNDQFDPAWKVWVNGNPAQLLRCNFMMRGVLLAPGQHTIKMRFEPPLSGLGLTLTAGVVGLVLCGLLFFVRPPAAPPGTEKPAAQPAAPPAKKPAK